MWTDIACEALKTGKVLELRYDGYSRSVKVHSVGYTKTNHAVMPVWQIHGGSASSERRGWMLMRLDEATSARVSEEESLASRLDYKPGGKAMAWMVCKLLWFSRIKMNF